MPRLLALILAAVCMTTAVADDASRPPRPKDGGTQVTFVMVASALIYCKTGRWPASIDEVLAFRKDTGFRADLAIQEEWLKSPHVRLVVEPSFVLRARDYLGRKYVIVEATQSAPKCADGSVEMVGANMHIGPDGDL